MGNTNTKSNGNTNVKSVGQECPTHTGCLLPCCLLDPKPSVVFWSFYQSSSDWILPNVFQFLVGAFL